MEKNAITTTGNQKKFIGILKEADDEILKAVGEDLAHVLNVPFPQRPGQPPTIDLPPVDMPKLNQQDADMIVASAFAGDPAVPGSGLSENDTTALAMTPD